MQNTLYVTTRDEKSHEHFYRLPLTDTVPDGHEIVNVRPAGQFRLSSLLSPESLSAIKSVRTRKGRK